MLGSAFPFLKRKALFFLLQVLQIELYDQQEVVSPDGVTPEPTSSRDGSEEEPPDSDRSSLSRYVCADSCVGREGGWTLLFIGGQQTMIKNSLLSFSVIHGMGEMDFKQRNSPTHGYKARGPCPYLLLDVRDREDYEQSHIITGMYICSVR